MDCSTSTMPIGVSGDHRPAVVPPTGVPLSVPPGMPDTGPHGASSSEIRCRSCLCV